MNLANPQPGVPTGFADLDHMTHGLHPGQVTVVTGPPGIGKSTTVTTIARHAAIRGGCSVAMFSLESPHAELVRRIASAEARVPLRHLRGGAMTDEDVARLRKTEPTLTDIPLHIHDNVRTVNEIEEDCRHVKEQSALDLVVIDSPSLLFGDRTKSREDETAEISRDIKWLAMRLDVPLLVTGRRRSLRHEGASGRHWRILEDEADLVIELHRPDAQDVQDRRAGEMDMTVSKHRNGPTGTIIVAHQFHYARLVDFAQT